MLLLILRPVVLHLTLHRPSPTLLKMMTDIKNRIHHHHKSEYQQPDRAQRRPLVCNLWLRMRYLGVLGIVRALARRPLPLKTLLTHIVPIERPRHALVALRLH